jgi:hypothetical protein
MKYHPFLDILFLTCSSEWQNSDNEADIGLRNLGIEWIQELEIPMADIGGS